MRWPYFRALIRAECWNVCGMDFATSQPIYYFCHSERSEESLRGLKPRKEREIPRFARNDKKVWGVFPRPVKPVPLQTFPSMLGGCIFRDAKSACIFTGGNFG